MKRMLFNATHAEELRVAIVDGQRLIDLDLESAVRSQKKGNIYKGVVTKVEPSLEACFVDYGTEKQGFLPLKEIYREYFKKYDSKTPITNVKIESVIKEGQQMIVQVDKDERGNKGAALTTFVSLAGRFLVLMPNNPKGGGISRRIVGEERNELRQNISGLEVDSKHSLIARTEGIGRTQEELQWDLDFLVKLWDTIEDASKGPKAPFLIYQESNLIVRSIRDHLSSDISEIIVDDQEVFDRASRFINQVMPHNINKLKYYNDSVPLFSRYQIEGQIESAFNREVSLPSGGSIAIDHTEALISIDVNSARATKGGDIEETALQTNLEAVEEVSRQLKIRDIGGLVVIDLIDMTVNKNQRAVESRLKEVLQSDRARVQVGHISRFGLLEMSRQRLRSSISESNYRQCPRCVGMGTIRSVVSSSLNLLRLIEDEALKENTEAIQTTMPLDMATYLLNEKRHELNQLEARVASRIIIIPSDELSSPHFQIKRLRSEELDQLTGIPSYEQKVEIDNPEQDVTQSLKMTKPEQAQVQLDQIGHSAPPPVTAPVEEVKPEQESEGLIQRISKKLFGPPNPAEEVASEPEIVDKQPQPKQTKPRPGSQQKKTRSRSGSGQQRKPRGQKKPDSEKKADGEKRPQQNRSRSQNRNSPAKKPGNGTGRKTQGQGQGQGQGRRQGQGQGQGQPKGNRQENASASGPTSEGNGTRSRQSKRGPRKKKQQPLPYINTSTAPEDIPADLPDDIGNRRD